MRKYDASKIKKANYKTNIQKIRENIKKSNYFKNFIEKII